MFSFFNLFSISMDSLTGGLMSGLVSSVSSRKKRSDSQNTETNIRAVGVTADDNRQVYGRLRNVSTGECDFQTEASFRDGEKMTLLVTVTGKGRPVTFNIKARVNGERQETDRRTYHLQYDVDRPHLRSLSGLPV